MSKSTIEDYRALDVRTLHRAGALMAGRSCCWEWSCQGEVVASMGIAIETLERLRYQLTQNGQTEVQDYPVPITWTPCHLGGSRPWFLCPCCGRRVAKLYLFHVFACRHCLRLNYRSQQANKRDRLCDRSLDLRRALGCDEGPLFRPAQSIPKPKGMHWRTFRRKLEQLKDVDDRTLAQLRDCLATLRVR